MIYAALKWNQESPARIYTIKSGYLSATVLVALTMFFLIVLSKELEYESFGAQDETVFITLLHLFLAFVTPLFPNIFLDELSVVLPFFDGIILPLIFNY